MTDRSNDPTAHDLPTSEELVAEAGRLQGEYHEEQPSTELYTPRQRDQRLLAGVRMVATLGHSCGLVDPYGTGPEPGASYSPMAAILDRLVEVSPWLADTWEYRQARARVEGRR